MRLRIFTLLKGLESTLSGLHFLWVFSRSNWSDEMIEINILFGENSGGPIVLPIKKIHSKVALQRKNNKSRFSQGFLWNRKLEVWSSCEKNRPKKHRWWENQRKKHSFWMSYLKKCSTILSLKSSWLEKKTTNPILGDFAASLWCQSFSTRKCQFQIPFALISEHTNCHGHNSQKNISSPLHTAVLHTFYFSNFLLCLRDLG